MVGIPVRIRSSAFEMLESSQLPIVVAKGPPLPGIPLFDLLPASTPFLVLEGLARDGDHPEGVNYGLQRAGVPAQQIFTLRGEVPDPVNEPDQQGTFLDIGIRDSGGGHLENHHIAILTIRAQFSLDVEIHYAGSAVDSRCGDCGDLPTPCAFDMVQESDDQLLGLFQCKLADYL